MPGKTLQLNVGGEEFQANYDVLTFVRGSQLAEHFLNRFDDIPRDVRGVLFIDRSPKTFRTILHVLKAHYYSHPMPEVTMTDMLRLDVAYYGLDGIFRELGLMNGNRRSSSRGAARESRDPVRTFRDDLAKAGASGTSRTPSPKPKKKKKKKTKKKKKKVKRKSKRESSASRSPSRGRSKRRQPASERDKRKSSSPGIIRFTAGITGTGGIPYIDFRQGGPETETNKPTDSEFRGPIYTPDWMKSEPRSMKPSGSRSPSPPRSRRERQPSSRSSPAARRSSPTRLI